MSNSVRNITCFSDLLTCILIDAWNVNPQKILFDSSKAVECCRFLLNIYSKAVLLSCNFLFEATELNLDIEQLFFKRHLITYVVMQNVDIEGKAKNDTHTMKPLKIRDVLFRNICNN